MQRRRLNGAHRRHAVANHVRHLFGVIAMGINAGIGAVGDLDAHRNGFAEDFALRVGRIAVFLHGLGRPSFCGSDFVDVIAIVDIGDQKHAARLHHPQRLIVEQRAMFNGSDAGANRHFCAFCAMGVRRHFFPIFPRLFNNGAHFRFGKLRQTGISADGQDRARGNHLQQVDAMLKKLPRLLARIVRPAHHAGSCLPAPSRHRRRR